MKKRKVLFGLMISLLLVSLLVACGGAAADPTEAPADDPVDEPEDEPTEEAPLRVAMIFPGTISDMGFNQAGYEGLLMIESELGAEIAYSENTPVAEYEQVYREYADQAYDVIIGHGFEFGEPALEIAEEYPDITFIVDSNPVVSAENVAGITGKSWEAAYLLGVLAAHMSESDKIGGIAGFDFPIIVSQMEAYKLGAQAVNPDIEVTIVYIGSFEDVALAKESALAQIDAGVDVLFHIADAAGIGIVQACEEQGIWAIGWGIDQNSLAPNTVISSMLFSGARLILEDTQMVLDGTWTGEVRLYGLETGVVGLADYYGLVPDDIAAEVEAVKQSIIDGETEVPYITEPTD